MDTKRMCMLSGLLLMGPSAVAIAEVTYEKAGVVAEIYKEVDDPKLVDLAQRLSAPSLVAKDRFTCYVTNVSNVPVIVFHATIIQHNGDRIVHENPSINGCPITSADQAISLPPKETCEVTGYAGTVNKPEKLGIAHCEIRFMGEGRPVRASLVGSTYVPLNDYEGFMHRTAIAAD